MKRSIRVALSFFVVGCSSSSTPATTVVDSGSGLDSSSDTNITADTGAPEVADLDAGPTLVTAHGTIVDFSSLMPVAGLSVTNVGATTTTATTDATGAWSLQLPSDALMQINVTGPSYTTTLFPDATPAASDVDFGTSVAATTGIYSLELTTLKGIDKTKALVQIVVVATGSCASVVGGTVSVVQPAGTQVEYFSSAGIPDATVTSFQKVEGDRPVAVVYNIAAGSEFSVTIAHPTCTFAAFPTVYNGKTYPGTVRTVAVQPNNVNGALVAVLQ